jgi:hypothetical protein
VTGRIEGTKVTVVDAGSYRGIVGNGLVVPFRRGDSRSSVRDLRFIQAPGIMERLCRALRRDRPVGIRIHNVLCPLGRHKPTPDWPTFSKNRQLPFLIGPAYVYQVDIIMSYTFILLQSKK